MPKVYRKKSSSKKKSSSALVSRVRKLEVKQKADDKATERKVFYYQTFTTMGSTWVGNNGFALRTAQGVQAEGNTGAGLNRIGNSVLLRSLSIAFKLSLPTDIDGVLNHPGSTTTYRIIIADNLSDDTALTASDLLENQTYALTSPYKNSIGAGKRYKVYADMVGYLNGVRPERSFKFNMKLPKSGRVVHFNGGATQPSDFNLSMIWIATNISITSTNQPMMQYYCKSRFEDQ